MRLNKVSGRELKTIKLQDFSRKQNGVRSVDIFWLHYQKWKGTVTQWNQLSDSYCHEYQIKYQQMIRANPRKQIYVWFINRTRIWHLKLPLIKLIKKMYTIKKQWWFMIIYMLVIWLTFITFTTVNEKN